MFSRNLWTLESMCVIGSRIGPFRAQNAPGPVKISSLLLDELLVVRRDRESFDPGDRAFSRVFEGIAET
ncbi:hypothetical protein E4U40_003654 [Claviceps sp. LM458 group G5]|nr:hypothetical protein E4U40_003654 [Claviceps sp. LM458 group G5]